MLRDALDGLTVIDFTQIGAGPTCTMLLADMGARVIKVEPPGGELGRGLGPGWLGDDSALFHGFNRNKLGVALDLKSPEGLAVARRMAAEADIVVESAAERSVEDMASRVVEALKARPDVLEV